MTVRDTTDGKSLANRSFRMGLGVFLIAAGIVAGTLIFGGLPDFTTADSGVNIPYYIAAILSVFGLWHLIDGLRYRGGLAKFGDAQITATPAILGRVFAGQVKTPADVAATGPFRFRLACEQRPAPSDDSSDGSGHQRTPILLWEARCEAAQSTPSSHGVPFSFQIPATGLANEGELSHRDGTVSWTLEVRAPVRGQDFVARFPVTVSPDGAASAPAKPFAGLRRPEQTQTRIFRWVSLVAGLLCLLVGVLGSLNQMRPDRGDHWVDALGTLGVGVVLLLISGLLWRRKS